MRNSVTRTLIRFSVLVFISACSFSSLKAQSNLNNDSLFRSGAENSGRVWGYAFGDFDYKSKADSLSRVVVINIPVSGRTLPCSSSGVSILDMTIISLKNSLLNCYLLQKTTFLQELHLLVVLREQQLLMQLVIQQETCCQIRNSHSILRI